MKANRYKRIIAHHAAKMRNINLSVVALFWGLLILSPFQTRGEEVFPGLSEMKNVESTYVSGRFSHSMPMWRSNHGGRPVDLSAGFSALYSYEMYSEEAVDKARSLLNDYLKKNKNVELMMRTKQVAGEYLIYEKFNEKGKLIQMIIWNSESKSIAEIVVIDWYNGLGGDTNNSQDNSSLFPSAPMMYFYFAEK